MSQQNLLPHKVDAFRFSENAIAIQGKLQIQAMPRLSAFLKEASGEVDVEMAFDVDEQGVYFVKGLFSTHLMLQCQRCLELFRYALKGEFLSGLVHTEEEIEQLPKSYDSIIVKEGEDLILQDIIEDELIVNLPIVPMHNLKDCKVKLPLTIESSDTRETRDENPFKVIELLRTKKRNTNE